MLVETPRTFNEILDLLWTEPIIAIDTETTGLQPYHGDRMIGLSLYFPEPDKNFYLPFRHEDGSNLPISWLKDLKSVYPRNNAVYVGHNIKFDLHVLEVDGFKRPNLIEDTMIAAHLLNENEPTFALKKLAVKYLGAWAGEGEEALQQAAIERGYSAKTQMAFLPASLVAPYAEMDTKITWALREFYRTALERWDQWDFYQERNEYLLKFLFEAEKNGIYINDRVIAENVEQINSRLPAIIEELRAEATLMGNSDYNPNSPAQTLDFLRGKGYDLKSTGADYLDPLDREGDYWPGQILTYRRLTKLNSSFYTPYLNLRDPNGFVHTTYRAAGPVTGRLSSSDPNLQQVPHKAKKGDPRNDVKAVFQPRPGYVFVPSDYRQLELRLAIHFANEKKMRQMFNEGIDLHQYTADELTRMLNYDINRDLGKRANFGLLYRMGPDKAALKFGIDLKLATSLVQGWRDLYPEFGRAYKSFMYKAEQWRDEYGRSDGRYQYIRLHNNRIKHFHEATRQGENETYKAWNFVVQGTGAAITEESALRISRIYDGDDRVLPVLTVHDSLVWEVRIDFVKEFVPVMTECMTDYPEYVVPLAIETVIGGSNWRDTVPYEEWLNENN